MPKYDLKNAYVKQEDSFIEDWLLIGQSLDITEVVFGTEKYIFSINYSAYSQSFGLIINHNYHEESIVQALFNLYQLSLWEMETIKNFKQKKSARIFANLEAGEYFDYSYNQFFYQKEDDEQPTKFYIDQTLTYEQGLLIIHTCNLCYWFMFKLLNLDSSAIDKVKLINSFTCPIYKASVDKQLFPAIKLTQEATDIIEYYNWQDLLVETGLI